MAFAVCTALDEIGSVAVLVGGSAATYYAPTRYQSRDADFVITFRSDKHDESKAISSIGFVEKQGVYRHPSSKYTVEFLPAPLAVAGDIITAYATVRRGIETLHVLHRADVVRDRLAAFYHWDDRSALRTAVDVALTGPLDLDAIRAWSGAEGASDKFDEFATACTDLPPSRGG